MQPAILYEDDDLIMVDKPAGITVIPERSGIEKEALNQLLEQRLQQKIWVVHRIDRQTSGLVCFAKTAQAHQFLSVLFQAHKIEKRYLGLVIGTVNPPAGTISLPIAEHASIKGRMITTAKGKPSRTDYEVLRQWPLYALVRFQIHTGRTHQIRVHMQSAGHPVLCDELYGKSGLFYLSTIKKKYRISGKEEVERPLLYRMALHAHSLQFTKESGERLRVEAPLPKDMQACIRQLDKWTGAGIR